MRLLFACLTIIFLSGCNHLTPAQKQVALTVTDHVVDFTQIAANLAWKVVLLKAQSPSDMVTKANWLDSLANGLRSVQSQTGGYVSPDVVDSVLGGYVDTSKTHWSDIVNDLVASLDVSPSTSSNTKLEDLAKGLNEQAALARDQALVPSQPISNVEKVMPMPAFFPTFDRTEDFQVSDQLSKMFAPYYAKRDARNRYTPIPE